jgi:putative acetyltransferase
MIIRREIPSDYKTIRDINIAAFLHHPFSHQTEHLIVEELRKAGALSVSLVAETGAGKTGSSEVVGHIAFSHALIDGRDNGCFMAGPLAVLPEFQKQGIGSALVKAGLKAIKKLGAKVCVLVGDPAYYTRFGFVHNDTFIIEAVPPEVVLVSIFDKTAKGGHVTHHPAFMTGL